MHRRRTFALVAIAFATAAVLGFNYYLHLRQAEAHALMAECRKRNADSVHAIEQCKELLENFKLNNNDMAETYFWWGLAEQDLENWEASLELVNTGIKAQPKYFIQAIAENAEATALKTATVRIAKTGKNKYAAFNLTSNAENLS